MSGIERLRLVTTACDMGVRTLSLVIVLGRLGLGRRCGFGSEEGDGDRQRLALCPKPGVYTLQGLEAIPAGRMGEAGRLLSESEEDSDDEKLSSGVDGEWRGDMGRGTLRSVVHASKARGWK